MNNKDFISELSTRTGYTTRDTQTLVNTLLTELTAQLDEGNIITVQNFGTFEVKKKLERVMVNPGTGQRMLIPPKLVVNFRPSNALKAQVQKGGEA